MKVCIYFFFRNARMLAANKYEYVEVSCTTRARTVYEDLNRSLTNGCTTSPQGAKNTYVTYKVKMKKVQVHTPSRRELNGVLTSDVNGAEFLRSRSLIEDPELRTNFSFFFLNYRALTVICLVFVTIYPKILKEVHFSTDNLLQSAIFYKILSLKLRKLEFLKMFLFSSEFYLSPNLKGQIFLQYTVFWTFVSITIIY